MLNTEFNSVIEPKYRDVDIYLKELRSQIDELNCWIYYTIKNDVYKAGFATKQVYDKRCKHFSSTWTSWKPC